MSYTEYYNTYKHKIFSYFFYNVSQDRTLAEDLTSDAFLKAFEKFETYDDTYEFSTWIFTIARNTLYDYYRSQKIDIPLEDDEEMTLQEFIKYEQDFDRAIDTGIAIEQVYSAMKHIPENQREVILMKYLEDFSTKEISSMIGKTEASIRKNLSR